MSSDGFGERRSLTRRKFLRRAGGYGAALGATSAFGLFQAGEAQASPPNYLTGFNDDFNGYAGTSYASATLDRVKFCNGKAIRIGVNWADVQAGGPSSYDWTNYDTIYAQALGKGVQILPTVFGCPSWANPQVTAPPHPKTGLYPDPAYRTCHPSYDSAFGNFVDQVVRHFDFFTKYYGLSKVITGVEITNEPNLWTFGSVPSSRLRDLTTAAANAVATSQGAGAFSGPMRVISGGLAPVSEILPGNPNFPPQQHWWAYLVDLVSTGSTAYDVGFHSYELDKPPSSVLTIPENTPSNPFGRAAQYVNWQSTNIVDQIDLAHQLSGRDIWVTETGASSGCTWKNGVKSDIFSDPYRATNGPTIQADVLAEIADEMKTRPWCKAMIVHRLYSNNTGEPPNTAYYQYGVYDAINGNVKVAAYVLQIHWS